MPRHPIKPQTVWIVELRYRDDRQDVFSPRDDHFPSREMARDEAKRHRREWPGTFVYRVAKYVRSE